MRGGGDTKISHEAWGSSLCLKPWSGMWGILWDIPSPQFHIIAGDSILTLEAEYIVVSSFFEIVPTEFTLHVVCSLQCHTNLSVNLDTWRLNDWKHLEGQVSWERSRSAAYTRQWVIGNQEYTGEWG